MSGLVTLWKFRDLPEALLAKGKLESAGIEAFLTNENTVRINWLYSNLIGGISLQVHPENASDALALLQEPIPEAIDPGMNAPAYFQPRCPQCSSLKVTHEGIDKLATYGTWLALGFPIRVTTDKWVCDHCGHEWQTQADEAGSGGEVRPEVMTRIYVATTNSGKIKDFATVSRLLGIEVVPFPNLKAFPEIIEDGQSFEDNAVIKAGAYSRELPNELVISDDSGLEVDALSGAPGVLSARFAASDSSKKPSDSDNNYRLIAELSAKPGCERGARFICVIAAARDGNVLHTFRGEARGEILPTPIGRQGFGYDPLFYVPAVNKTFAEMNAEEKSTLSHRGIAFRKFLEWLKPEVSGKG